jgi:hypothetical protein
MGDAQHHSARVFEWASDGRSFVTGVVHPYRRVDNKLCVWKYTGEMMYEEAATELYQCVYRPMPDGHYPDRPQSPKRKEKEADAADAAASSSAAGASSSSAPSAGAATAVAAAKPAAAATAALKGAYVPPHMRNQAGAAERVKIDAMAGPVSAPRRLERPPAGAVASGIVPHPNDRLSRHSSITHENPAKFRDEYQLHELHRLLHFERVLFNPLRFPPSVTCPSSPPLLSLSPRSAGTLGGRSARRQQAQAKGASWHGAAAGHGARGRCSGWQEEVNSLMRHRCARFDSSGSSVYLIECLSIHVIQSKSGLHQDCCLSHRQGYRAVSIQLELHSALTKNSNS